MRFIAVRIRGLPLKAEFKKQEDIQSSCKTVFRICVFVPLEIKYLYQTYWKRYIFGYFYCWRFCLIPRGGDHVQGDNVRGILSTHLPLPLMPCFLLIKRQQPSWGHTSACWSAVNKQMFHWSLAFTHCLPELVKDRLSWIRCICRFTSVNFYLTSNSSASIIETGEKENNQMGVEDSFTSYRQLVCDLTK